ncbi:hypothetical protein [Sanguibacter sp. Z1732]|uniref:hypothetical protein n=1 Tax=Sanguibacter sp. Z1732 TaxID=3435412 RepID=UPI003D9C8657
MEVNNHWFTGADGTTWVRLDDAERRVAAVIGQRDQARDIAVALEQENAYLGANWTMRTVTCSGHCRRRSDE